MDKAAILYFFSGKALLNAEEGLSLLEASIEAGYWLPGASRRVRATLTKANIAQRFARNNEYQLEHWGVPAGESQYDQEFHEIAQMGWNACHMMQYGGWAYIKHINIEKMREVAADRHGTEANTILDIIEQYMKAFAPVQEAVLILDATRPAPVYTNLGVSPTVSDTLRTLTNGMDSKLDTIRPVPSHMEKEERTDLATGQKFFVFVTILDWPEGVRHNRSRYAGGTIHNNQCHACGHAIKNGYNWVPVLVDDAEGVPHSLWVGRDCARSIFGIDVKGELEYTNSNR